MCGIAGFLSSHQSDTRDTLISQVSAMSKTLEHRGPNHGGTWADESSGIALGAQRLSIVDLGESGNQPKMSKDERWVIIFNGEIYNCHDLQKELETSGHYFRGYSDTEVVAEAIAQWGVVESILRFNGMFAIAAWDRKERKLYLVRDRLGIKPLYWGQTSGYLLFGSELKSLRAHKGWSAKIDQNAMAAYFQFAYVPAPQTIYRGIKKLLPGHILTMTEGDEPKVSPYWSLQEEALKGIQIPCKINDDECIDNFDTLLRDAISLRRRADVPIGTFLSGGIDSTLVTAVLSTLKSSPVNTFTIGFQESDMDESRYAETVAHHLGTNHISLPVELSHITDIIPQLPEWYDEPFADSSQIPTALVSQLAKSNVTVALSGDGGDELFGGYDRYHWGDNLLRRIKHIPAPLRQGAASVASFISQESWDMVFSFLPKSLSPGHGGKSLHWLAEAASKKDAGDLHRHLVEIWKNSPLQDAPAPSTPDSWNNAALSLFKDPVDRMQYSDAMVYLPDDILTKLDRASMAFGLEARVPLLDHRIVSFAWALPRRLKTNNGTGKVIMRQLLERYIPKEIIDRPKKGFSVPLGDWLRGCLREWAESLLSLEALQLSGMLNSAYIRASWESHLRGDQDYSHRIWTVLMFQAWYKKWV